MKFHVSAGESGEEAGAALGSREAGLAVGCLEGSAVARGILCRRMMAVLREGGQEHSCLS